MRRILAQAGTAGGCQAEGANPVCRLRAWLKRRLPAARGGSGGTLPVRGGAWLQLPPQPVTGLMPDCEKNHRPESDVDRLLE